MIFGRNADFRRRLQLFADMRQAAARADGRSMIVLDGMGKGRGGKGRDTGGGRASLPLSHGAYGGEGAASALRRGEWRRLVLPDRAPRGEWRGRLARTIEGIVRVASKVLCLLMSISERSSAKMENGHVCSG